MSAAKHTPGPWTYEGTKDRHEQPQVVGPEGQLVAVVTHECISDREQELEANAALIAAAPDLLTALRGLLASLGTMKIEGTLLNLARLSKTVGEAEAALAKAGAA